MAGGTSVNLGGEADQEQKQQREGGGPDRQAETVSSIHPSIQTQRGWQLNRAVLKPHYFQAYKPISSHSFSLSSCSGLGFYHLHLTES